MLEFWNDGFKETPLKRLLFFFDTQYSSIPLFHYSIWLIKKTSVKNTVTPINSRNPDPFNYLSTDFEIPPMLRAAAGE